MTRKDFWEARKRWYDDCLQEFIERYGDTLYGGPRYHPFMDPPEDEDPNAVTPWDKSPHYVE